jgi:hypothetical protein
LDNCDGNFDEEANRVDNSNGDMIMWYVFLVSLAYTNLQSYVNDFV